MTPPGTPKALRLVQGSVGCQQRDESESANQDMLNAIQLQNTVHLWHVLEPLNDMPFSLHRFLPRANFVLKSV